MKTAPFLVIFILVGNPALSQDQAPIKCMKTSYAGMRYLSCNILSEDLVIREAIFNRGNCPPASSLNPNAEGLQFTVNKSYKFGDQLALSANVCPNILEIEMQTNKGNWTLRFM